jgi:hypothetical protein
MEWMALATKFDPSFVNADGTKKKLQLFIKNTLADSLWENVMKGGCATMQGVPNNLGSYFDVVRVPRNGSFEFQGIDFKLVQTIHYVDNSEIVPSYGLQWKSESGKIVFLTTDTQFAPHSIKTFYNQSDIVFHDCETSPYPTGIHAHFNELKTLPSETKSKMWLYHYNDGQPPDALAEGFAGFVPQGHTFEL